jgi:hypothetical protein
LEEINKMVDILSSFLGEPKDNDCEGNNFQLQFSCPRCVERDGNEEVEKKNLEVNVRYSVYNCWKCSSMGDDEMKGKISKLFRLYANESLWNEYKECLKSIRDNELYSINFDKNDFRSFDDEEIKKEIEFPLSYVEFNEKNVFQCIDGFNYLSERKIGWDKIKKYQIGFTKRDREIPMVSNRIIIPSFDSFGQLNYWVGRDFTGKSKMKYWNSKAEKKNIIFNENLINWDADIYLVEGPFDYLCTDINCIPLLGKALTSEYRIYQKIFEKSNANVNIFLDGDAKETAIELYKTLNQGKMYGKIRYISLPIDLDPADIYKKWGKRGIIQFLKSGKKIKEAYL